MAMLVANGSSRRKLGLSNSSESNVSTPAKVSSRRLMNQQIQAGTGKQPTAAGSKQHTSGKNASAKNLNSQIKLKKSLGKAKKNAATTVATGKLSGKNLSNQLKGSAAGKTASGKKHKLKERRLHRHSRVRDDDEDVENDEENDENEPDEYRVK